MSNFINTYTNLQGWMVEKLNLSGRELICYALIYGFTQDNESVFCGSRKYLSKWLGCTLPTVDSTLKELMNRGLIVKKTETINNVQFNRYKCVELNENYEPKKEAKHQDGSKEILVGSKTTLQGSKMALHDNNSYNNIDNKDKKEDNKLSSKKDCIDYRAIVDCWNECNGKRIAKVTTITTKRKAAIKKILLDHNITQDVFTNFFKSLPYADSWLYNPKGEHKNWKPDFDWWLSNSRGWLTKGLEGGVHKENPQMFNMIMCGEKDSVYMPQGYGIYFDQSENIYYLVDNFFGKVYDSYDDNTRPDGATMKLNNARGTIIWSKERQVWDLHKI